MEINLKIEAPGLMEAILALAEQLQEHNALLADKPAPTEPIKTKEIEEPKVKKEEKKAEPKEEPKEEETKEETKSEPFYTVDEVRAKFMEKNSGANRPKLKAILTDHGVSKVTDLKEEQFKSVIDALEEI